VFALRPRLALLLSAGAIALVTTGCAPTQGASDDDKEFTGVQGQVANTIDKLDDAYEDEQQDTDNGAKTVCQELLSKRLVAQLEARGGCEKVTRDALEDADPISMSTQAVQVRGDQAIATVRLKLTNDDYRTDTLTLVREGRGTWKLDATKRGAVTGGD
jgi:hypothetical protein